MRIHVLADELTASGWRLVGAETRVPTQADAAQIFAASLSEGDVVLMTPAVAEWIEPQMLEEAQLRTQPLVVIVPDVRGETPPPDLERVVKRALGIEA